MLEKNMGKAHVLNALLTSVFTGKSSLQESRVKPGQPRQSWDQGTVITGRGVSG